MPRRLRQGPARCWDRDAVTLPQPVQVMLYVTPDYVEDRARADRGAAHRPALLPPAGRDAGDEVQRPRPDCFELVEEGARGASIESGRLDVAVFIESGERRLIAPADPEKTISEDPLGIR